MVRSRRGGHVASSASVSTVLALVGALASSACSYTGPATGPGVVTIQTPGVIPPVVVIAPPGAALSTDPRRPAAPRQGAYAGLGHVLDDPGGACASLNRQFGMLPPSNAFAPSATTGAVRVDNFVVRGDGVSMGPFTGTIGRDGTVSMQAGSAYVLGKFTGDVFIGRYWQPQPGCTYSMVLHPVG